MGGSALILLLFTTLVVRVLLKLHQTLDQYQHSQARLQRLAAQLRDIVLLLRASDPKIVDTNDAAVGALGLKELRTRRLDHLYPDIVTDQLLHTLYEESLVRLESTALVRPQRRRILTDSTVTWLDNSSREILRAVSSGVSHRARVEDLRKEKQRQLARLARYDRLTGLPNRQRLIAQLEKTLRRWQAPGLPLVPAVMGLNLAQCSHARPPSTGIRLDGIRSQGMGCSRLAWQ